MRPQILLSLFCVLFLAVACVSAPTPSPVPAVPAGWQTYANPAGFSMRYPATWSQQDLALQAGETFQTAVVQGPEGEIELHWGTGFGGACPQGYTTVRVAAGELPACYSQQADGTEIWTQINQELPATSFSAEARTNNANLASHDLVLEVLSTLSFAAAEAAPQEPDAAALTARMLTAPGALVGPSPSSFVWSPAGARLIYVEPQEGQDVLWLYDAPSGEKRMLLDPAEHADDIDLTTAQWSPQGDRLLLSGDTALWLLDMASGELSSLLASDAAKTSVGFTPDGQRISYVQDNDLYLAGIDDGQVQRLTTDGGETVFNGALDWVYTEELATRAAQPAYAWSPDSNWLIYLRLDESAVANDPVTDYRPVPATVSYTRYPTAGTANPVATLHALTPDALAPPLAIQLPVDTEYVLPFFTWTPDSNHALFITVDRDHTRLKLNRWTPQSGEVRTILTETDAAWINEERYAAPIFLGDGEQFLWVSERDGFMHLYLFDGDGTLVQQLTTGDWMIDTSAWNLLTPGRPVHVDPTGTWAYFITTRATPLERQIERVNLTTGELEQVSTEPGFHLFSLSADGQFLVDQFSDVTTPPITRLVKTDGSDRETLAAAAGPSLDLPALSREFVTLQAHDGTDLYAQLVKPENFDHTQKYPVVVHWYGGPGLQMVSNRYGTTNIFNIIERDVLYTQEGFLVWRLDNRGSLGRGHAFETPIFGELGKAGLDDQLAGIEYLQTLPYVDATRIGTDGKSFGGYMTLYALLHAPDVFRCGVAGAAPTDWRYYDTIYTERYMRTPEKNPDGYAATNLIDLAGQIQARPLLIHGLQDTNVHLQNTVNFIEALEKNDRLFDFIPLPNLSHSFRGDGLVAALSASADYLGRCLTVGAPVVAPTPVPTTAPPAETLQPLSPDACADLAQAMAAALKAEITQAEVPFTDPAAGASGTACQASASGTGAQFVSPQAVVDTLAGMLEGQGWQEDMQLAAGGPTGTASGFRQDNQVCLASAVWQPDASVTCPRDRPIAECQVPPDKQVYTVTLTCAQAPDPLASWNDGPAKTTILQFIADVTNPASPSYVPPADRIAVFDNDGTLWTEKPLPVQADFLFTRIAEMAPEHPEWQTTQPYQAVLEQDAATLQNLSPEDVETLLFATHAGMTEEAFDATVATFLSTAQHPRFGVPYTETVYQPLLELLAFLRAHDFQTFIVSGGGVEFMRAFSEEVYGIPRANVIGSSLQYAFQQTPEGSVLVRQPEVVSFDDRAMKPVNIQLHIGRRPILAVGNSNGDLEMFQYTGGDEGPFLNLAIVHDDAEREYDYLAGTDELMSAAAQSPWVLVSMQRDFKTIFP